MRISAGKVKNHKILFPRNREFRPTKDNVKEAIFDIIYSNQIPPNSFLDLFAGSGQVGFEAWSRDFQKVVMIDKETKFLKKNYTLFQSPAEVEIYGNDALRAIQILKKRDYLFDIIFLDPPYTTSLIEDSLNKLYHFDILDNRGLVVAEVAKNTTITNSHFKIIKEYNYGMSSIITLKKGF